MRLANLAILVLLGLPSAALADGKDDKVAAQKHVDLAKRHYNVAKYDDAIAEFKEAYTLDPDPADLFNIAQAYRLKKDCENAALFYASYQREEKNKKLRDSVTKVRADMEACAKEAKPEPTPVEPTPVPPPPTTGVAEPGPVPGPAPVTAPATPLPPPTEAPVSDPDPNRARRITGKVLLVTGAALLTIALLEVINLDSIDGKRRDAGCDTDLPDDICGQLDADRADASRSVTGGLAFGSVTVAVGFVLWRISRKPDRPSVTLVPRRNGAVLSWSF